MSIDLVAACLWLPLEPNRKLVLLALCERADLKTGRCWPGREEIAVRASLSVRSVTPHLQALEVLGYLHSRRRDGGRRQTTLRQLAVSRILKEGEAIRAQFVGEQERSREDALSIQQEDSSPDQFKGKLPAHQREVGDIAMGSSLLEQGEAASLVTAIEPSLESSYNRQSAEREKSGQNGETETAQTFEEQLAARHPSRRPR